jgi:hypothetical protein
LALAATACAPEVEGGDGWSDASASSSSSAGAGGATARTSATSSVVAVSSSGAASSATVTSSSAATTGAGGASCAGAGCLEWMHLEGASSDDGTEAIAVDASGNVLAAGFFEGTMNVDGLGSFTSEGGNDAFVVKYSPAGAPLWIRTFGGADDDACEGLAVDARGNAFVVGYYGGSVPFDATTLTADAAQAAFVAELDPSGGVVWARSLSTGSALDMRLALAPATGPAGERVVVARQSADFDALTLTSLSESGDTVVDAAFSATGGELTSEDVAVDSEGNVVLVGELEGSTSFGGAQLTSAGGRDGFIAKFDASGAHLWSKIFGDAHDQYANSIAPDAQGNLALCGAIYGSADLGGGTLTASGDADVMIAMLDPSGGHLWSRVVGDRGSQSCRRVARDAAGSVLLTGWIEGHADFGGGALTSSGGDDLFLVKLDATGAFVWGRLGGDAAEQYGSAVAAGPSGEVVLGAWVESSIDLGLGRAPSHGGFDALVAKFSP